MAYIGANPQTSLQQYLTIDDISGSFNGVLTSFALQVGGVAPVPGPSQSNQLLISLGGVIQEPDDTGSAGFRLSGGNIIFSSAPASSTAFFGVVLAGADYIYAGTNFPDGSVTTPSITFANDLDSGFYRTGSGELAYTSNGTFRLKIDSSGRLGVGTSSPSAPLHVLGAATVSSVGDVAAKLGRTGDSAILIGSTDGNKPFIASEGAFSLFLRTDNQNALVIDSSQRVGIGTSSPAEQLELAKGSERLMIGADSPSTFSRIAARNTANDGYRGLQIDGSSLLINSNTSGNVIVATGGGNVGIGTTSPSTLLHLASSNPGIRLQDTDGGRAMLMGSGASIILDADPDNQIASTGILFRVDDSERARIDSSGRLLVGTTNAGTDSGADDLVIANDGSSSDQAGIKIRGGTAGRSQIFFSDGTTGQDEYRGMIRYEHSDDSMQFRTNASEKLRINASGAMGLGVNPEPQGSGFTNFQFGGLGNLGASTSQAAGGAIYLYNNTYRATVGQWRYLVTDEATRYQALNGRHQFDVAPSGTADTTVSFSEKLRIDSDGLKFNGNTDAKDALDDYEEGTWTPSVTFGGGSTGVTYSTYNRGWYTKIGRVVVLKMALEVSNKGTSTGNVLVAVPFSSSLTQASHAQVVGTARVNAQTTMLYGVGAGNFELKKINASTSTGATTLTDADFGTNFSVIASITYML